VTHDFTLDDLGEFGHRSKWPTPAHRDQRTSAGARVGDSEAPVAEWVSVLTMSDGSKEVFVDVSSIHAVGGGRRAWFKHVFAAKYAPSMSGKVIAYVLSRDAFNCDDETYRLEGDLIHFVDGTDRRPPPSDVSTGWQPVAPDTLFDIEMRFICSWATK
jgi:hypothetical protein